jgi:DNA-binding NarL/FixJ family response regulator
MWRIIACTDEPIVSIGLQALLGSDSEFHLISVCANQAEVVRAAAEHRPDLLLYGFTTETDLAILTELRRVAPELAVVLWSRDTTTELAHQAMGMGARGFLSSTSSPETLRECLRASTSGEMWMEKSLAMSLLTSRPVTLSKRQSQLLALLVQGLKNKEIATTLGISEGTVKAYLTTLFEKVGAKDRFELALFGLKNLRNVREVGTEPELRMTGQVRSVLPRRAVRRTVA